MLVKGGTGVYSTDIDKLNLQWDYGMDKYIHLHNVITHLYHAIKAVEVWYG